MDWAGLKSMAEVRRGVRGLCMWSGKLAVCSHGGSRTRSYCCMQASRTATSNCTACSIFQNTRHTQVSELLTTEQFTPVGKHILNLYLQQQQP